MKPETVCRIYLHHKHYNAPIKIGRFWYETQYNPMNNQTYIIRCPDGYQNGLEAVEYNFCGEAVKTTFGSYWEWYEPIREESWKLIDEKEKINPNDFILEAFVKNSNKTEILGVFHEEYDARKLSSFFYKFVKEGRLLSKTNEPFTGLQIVYQHKKFYICN